MEDWCQVRSGAKVRFRAEIWVRWGEEEEEKEEEEKEEEESELQLNKY